jgi:hypothetical protein
MYTLETNLDKLPIGESKRLALVDIKVQMRARVKSKEYYERHRKKVVRGQSATMLLQKPLLLERQIK